MVGVTAKVGTSPLSVIWKEAKVGSELGGGGGGGLVVVKVISPV